MNSIDRVLVSVPTKTLAEYRCYDPFKFSPRAWAQKCTFLPDTNEEEWRTLPEWENNPIRREEIADKIASQQFRDAEGGQTRNEHLERIAHLVVHGCPWPITLRVTPPRRAREVGIEPGWGMSDGFHRLAAAMYRQDEFIPCFVNGFHRHQLDEEDVAYIEQTLGCRIPPVEE
jgi:hypothetical protein